MRVAVNRSNPFVNEHTQNMKQGNFASSESPFVVVDVQAEATPPLVHRY